MDYDELLREKKEQLRDIELDLGRLETAIAVRDFCSEQKRKAPKNGDIFKSRSGRVFIVRVVNGSFISMNSDGEENDNTMDYKEHFPDKDWKRIGNVFEDYKDK